MSENSFQKDSLGWQIQQIQQQISEWWELQIAKVDPDLPEIDLPSWWDIFTILMIAKIVAWLIFAGLLSWLAIKIIRIINPYFYHIRNSINLTTKTRENLETDLSITGWLNQSQKFQKLGNYGEAFRCLYMAMLQGLNDREIILHQSSRTDGEYLKLIQNLSQSQPYQKLFIIHQQLLFADLEISASMFQECQQAYQQIKDEEK
ncbi:DUF4129 domain-containing protein [Okeania sp.]|uniref:DUF4129 domain-containing protein n=1 Tax=Okeania sp. TaxID=3100323 RepID=UPI002B4AAF59|nr:DUF4129 domain-containing protein [Okeania sp.]MEB3340403.1 DUF4129 domain-containing protein [Okeania sp.]